MGHMHKVRQNILSTKVVTVEEIMDEDKGIKDPSYQKTTYHHERSRINLNFKNHIYKYRYIILLLSSDRQWKYIHIPAAEPSFLYR